MTENIMTIIEKCHWIAKILFGLEAEDAQPTPAPAWTRRKNCKICKQQLCLLRLKRWPHAALCGRKKCTVTNARRKHTRCQKVWREKRLLLEPGWRLTVNKKQRDNYWRDRKPSPDTKVA